MSSSYTSKYSSKSDSHSHSKHRTSSSRHDSPDRHRSRRSPSPILPPRDPKNLPDSFGRGVTTREAKPDDDLSVLQRMKSSYENSPLQNLYRLLRSKEKIKIWTRNFKEIRGVMTGYIVAFDKHWNMILKDVDEVYFKRKKNKTPFLRDLVPHENLPDIPARVPKKKGGKKTEPPPPAKPKEGETEKKRKKKLKTTCERRHVEMLFLRGDSIVIISPIDNDPSEDEDEVEEEVISEA